MDVTELISRGFTHLELVQDLDANITVANLEDAGVSADDIAVLRSTLADLEKGSSNLDIIAGLVVAVVVIVGIVLFCICRSKSTTDHGASIADDVEVDVQQAYGSNVERRPKDAGSRPSTRPLSSWMRDASRTDAETLLKGCRSGAFLVRPRNDTSYAFSVIIRNRVIHKLIQETASGAFTVDGKSGDWSSSLESVVAVVSLQMGTKYECSIYPLSAAAQQPATAARRAIRANSNAQPRQRARNAAAHSNTSADEYMYEEFDDGFRDATAQEKTYEEIDESGGINSGVYETAFSLNPAYSSVQEAAAAAPQESVQVRRMPGYENAGAQAHSPNNTASTEVPVVTINPHYNNDDAANDPTSAQVTTADPYASLLSVASTYGAMDSAVVDFNDEDTDDEESDIDI